LAAPLLGGGKKL